MSRPSFQFYPADWLKDLALQSCSWEARGVHINAICYLHQSQKYWRFIIKGKPMSVERIARILAAPEDLLHELIEADVLKVSDRRGVVFSARMLRDEHERIRWARKKRQWRTNLSQDCPKRQGPVVPPLSPPSSSSPSSSPSLKAFEDEDPPNPPRGGTGAAGKPAKTPKVQPAIPTALDTAAFREAWATWIEHRREIRKPATPRAMKQQLVNLEAIGHDRAIAAIKHSVGNGWAGIFEAGPSSGAGRTGGGDRLGRVEAPPGKYDKYDLAMQKLQADRLAAKSKGDGGSADNEAAH